MNLNQLDKKQLSKLHKKVVAMRKKVLELVDEYDNQNASSLVSRSFEKEIEQAYGRKVLNKK